MIRQQLIDALDNLERSIRDSFVELTKEEKERRRDDEDKKQLEREVKALERLASLKGWSSNGAAN